MRRRFILRILPVFALLAMSCSAQASVLFVGGSYNGGPVNLILDNAGRSEAGGSIDHSTLNLGSGPIDLPFVYCVDILTNVYVGNSYNPTLVTTNGQVWSKTVDDPNPSLHTLQNADKIAWLLTNIAPTIKSNPDGSRSPAIADAQLGLQAAIWQQVYGNDFVMGSNSTGIANAYNTYIAALNTAYGNGETGNVADVLWLSPGADGSNQALVTVLPTPEPGSLIVWGLSLCAMGCAWSRRRFAA